MEDLVIVKHRHSAFQGTDLDLRLRAGWVGPSHAEAAAAPLTVARAADRLGQRQPRRA